MKRNVLIIGAGGVAQVVAHKCAQNNDVLGDLHIASRTVSKCEAIIESVHAKGAMKQDGVFKAHAVDGMDSDAVEALINDLGVQIVINVGSPFVNMTVLEACIRTGVAYIDTAIHEDPTKICETPRGTATTNGNAARIAPRPTPPPFWGQASIPVWLTPSPVSPWTNSWTR
jgi:saccharopine dehydrogenase-like NADP-dependent oxidoreductase